MRKVSRSTVSVLALLAGCVSGPPSTPGGETFAQLDRDRDGRLTAAEAPAAMQADADEDGAVTQAEHRAWLAAPAVAASPRPVEVASEGPEPVPAAMEQGLPADPERTQRAREVYLSGVKLLASTPPQVDRAIRELQQALSLDPLFYKAHFKLGICYYHKGHYDLEINEYRKCLTINRSYVPAWLNLGHAHLARDELEKAREAYEHVLDLEPKHGVALYNKALVEFDLRNEDESLRLFRAFLDVDGTGEMGDRARRYVEELERRKQEGG